MDAKPKKILIIEDEEAMSQVIRDSLEMNAFDVEVANNGEEGIKALNESKPDLIILDIIMPKVDGVTVIKNINENEDLKKIHLVMLTNLNLNDKILAELDGIKKYKYLIKSEVE